jgi:hypothetical protein
MADGALPVGPINDDDPEAKEGYEGSGDDDRLKLSEENHQDLLKGIAECSDPGTLVAKLEALLPEGKWSPPASSGDLGAK